MSEAEQMIIEGWLMVACLSGVMLGCTGMVCNAIRERNTPHKEQPK